MWHDVPSGITGLTQPEEGDSFVRSLVSLQLRRFAKGPHPLEHHCWILTIHDQHALGDPPKLVDDLWSRDQNRREQTSSSIELTSTFWRT